MRVFCVLRSGGDYRPEHVERLASQVLQNSPAGVEVVCLTDMVGEVLEGAPPVTAAMLSADWPGWWSKIELFRHPGPILYLDLDSTVRADLSPLLAEAERRDLVMWSTPSGEVGSGVMAWRGDLSSIWREFAKSPARHMAAYKTRPRWGDQGFIRDHAPCEVSTWREVLPGAVISRKLERGGDWSKCRVEVYHGRPRPWEIGA